MPIGNRISALLGERRESITDLARGAGISYSAAFALYHGKGNGITWEVLEKLCRYFKASPCELFPYQPDKEESRR